MWGPTGALTKAQGSFNLVQDLGHKGPVLKTRCIGPGSTRTHIFLFYSVICIIKVFILLLTHYCTHIVSSTYLYHKILQFTVSTKCVHLYPPLYPRQKVPSLHFRNITLYFRPTHSTHTPSHTLHSHADAAYCWCLHYPITLCNIISSS